MIVDVHTHVFPPDVRDNRAAYLERDATFREIYTNPNAALATAEDLLASMDEAGVDQSVACGFAWRDAELCRQHSGYLLEAAGQSGGRLIPFCTLQPSDEGARKEMERYAARGARGLGELRPEQQGYGLIDSGEADLLAWGAEAYDLVLLFHVSEPVGHVYPGKSGLSVEQLGRFVGDFPGVTVIASHWGGGLPFYALMPEVRETLAGTYFDTAATSLLYQPEVYAHAVALVGPERVLFGSDFPLVPQARAMEEVRSADIEAEAQGLILGENARGLLRLSAK
ncbi:MAG: amidohydrolase family protein [Dehalococcoidia bacterium]|nr:amidohydrolase family protein [Dehalococcoidia bacterium]